MDLSKNFVSKNEQKTLLSKGVISEAIYKSLGIFLYEEGIFFESKFLLLHKNLNFPVMPLVVILCHCFKVDIFHFFLFFHAPTFSFFLYTHNFFFNTHFFLHSAKHKRKGKRKFFSHAFQGERAE